MKYQLNKKKLALVLLFIILISLIFILAFTSFIIPEEDIVKWLVLVNIVFSLALLKIFLFKHIKEQRIKHHRYHVISEIVLDNNFYYSLTIAENGDIRFEWLDGPYEQISGYNYHFIKDYHNWLSIIQPDDYPNYLKARQRVILNNPSLVEFRIRNVSGRVRWLKDYARPIWNESQKRVTSVIGVIQDITDDKVTHDKLTKTHDQLYATLNALADLFFETDQHGDIYYFHSPDKERKNLPPYIFFSRNVKQAFPTEAANIIMNSIAQAAEHGRYTGSIFYLNFNDEIQWYELSVAKMTQENQAKPHFIVLSRNITERQKTQEMIMQTEKMMSIGGLAAGIAHEINNPLAGILQSAQNIQRRISTDIPKNKTAADELAVSLDSINAYLEKRGIVQFIDSIHESGRRASKIVTNMLQFARDSYSKKLPYNIHDVIDQMIELAQNDYDLQKKYDFKKIRIHKDYDPNLPPVPFIISEMEQVVFNILKNSSQALYQKMDDMTQLKIIIRTNKENGYAVIEFADNGPGMDTDTLKNIFEPFFTTKGKGTGTGLGLYISYFIITHNHNGVITAESEVNKGSKFVVKLPLKQK